MLSHGGLVQHLSELQASFAGCIGERGDPTGVGVATTVEHHLGNPSRLGRLSELLANLLRALDLVTVGQLESRRRRERDAPAVVDQLHEQVTRAIQRCQEQCIN